MDVPNPGHIWAKIFMKSHFMREDSYFYYWICDFGHFYEVSESSPRMEEFQKDLF